MRVPRQWILIGAALALWSIRPEPALWALVLAYGVAWLGINAIAVLRPRWLDLELGRPQLAIAAVLVFAAPAVALVRAADDIVLAESLLGVEENVADRIRLEATPSIAPPIVHTDHPQTFYVHAPGGSRVRVRLGPRGATLDAVSLGEGLFRADYDPRRHGAPHAGEGEVAATIDVDGDRATRTMRVIRPLAHPRWLRPSRDRRLAATVSEETDELAIVSERGLLLRAPTGDAPTDCAFVGDGRVAVSHRFDPSTWILDARSGRAVAKVRLDRFQTRMAVAPEATKLAVAVDGRRRGVFVVALPSLAVEAFVSVDAAPDWIAFGEDDATIVVSSRRPAALHRLRARHGRWSIDAAPLLLGRPPSTMARAERGARVIVATTDLREDGEPHLGNHFVQDQLVTVDVAEWRVRAQHLTARRSPRQGSPGDVDRGVSPIGIDALDDGTVAVAFAGTDELWTIDPDRVEPRALALDEHPLAAPHGVAMLAEGALAVASPSNGTIAIVRGDGTIAALARLAPDDDALLARSEHALMRRLGERGFYESTRAGVSCQSCHMHGDTDGAMHAIGERRLAPALTTRGVAGTAPYLRDGSFPRLRDLDDLSSTLYRGFRRRVPSRGLVLEAYVASLARTPSVLSADERDDARERRGVAAFVRARCPTCHTFPAFTNLGQHPLAVLFPDRAGDLARDAVLDTPSLLSVAAHPRYLSDGRARTLRSVIEDHNRAGRHGHTEALSPREVDDLVFFLESL